MLVDYCLISGLLLASHLLRSQSRVLQRLFLPTPIIAGLIGLAFGAEGFDVLPFHRREDGSTALATYPSVLISLLFATLFMGGKQSSAPAHVVMRRAGDTFLYNLAGELGQYGVALLFGVTVLAALFPDLHPGFALLLPAGFVGGHGTVTAMSQAFENAGWSEALTIGYTFATFGMLSAVVGGMLLINLGAARGWTRFVRRGDALPESLRKGFVPADERRSVGQETVSPIALDPLAWHAALVFAAYGLAYAVDVAFRAAIGDHIALPLFALAMLAGGVLQKSLDGVGLGGYVDRPLMERIGSALSDYLVAFGVASIKIDVVVQHAAPITMMCVLGLAYAVGMFWFLGPRLFVTYWFERSIFVYGWNTGVVGVAIALLRVVDPRLRSGTLEDFGLAYIGISFATIALIVALPQLVLGGYASHSGAVLIAAFLACILVSRSVYGWFAGPRDEVRADEHESEAN